MNPFGDGDENGIKLLLDFIAKKSLSLFYDTEIQVKLKQLRNSVKLLTQKENVELKQCLVDPKKSKLKVTVRRYIQQTEKKLARLEEELVKMHEFIDTIKNLLIKYVKEKRKHY